MNLDKIEKLVKIIENSSMLDFSIQEGDVKNGSVMAGQIAGMVKERMSCKELVQKLVNETDALIGGKGFYE